MKSNKIMPGVILVAIGAIFLLHNFGVIHFNWANVFYLWPVFLILAGINLLLARNQTPWAGVIKIVAVVLAVCLLIFAPNKHRIFWNNHGGNWNFSDHDTDGDNDDDSDSTDSRGVIRVEGNSKYNEPFTAGTTNARLNIKGGASSYELKDTTSQLFQADARVFYSGYEFTHSMDGSTAVVNFNMKDTKNFHIELDGDKTNKAQIKLNAAPVWDININAGASAVDFDLSKFKVAHLTFNGGAAAVDVKMGMPQVQTNVEMSTGMSGVSIEIPTAAACRITSNSGFSLSSSDFEGFDDKGNGVYETPGFAAAKNKMYIHLKGGMSGFDVKRY